MYIMIKDLSVSKRLTPRRKLCSDLYAYPIDSNAVYEAQLLKNFRTVPKNWQSLVIVS